MPTTIRDGGLTTKDSSEVLLYTMDYDVLSNLAVGVELASVGTFTITPAGLTQSNLALQSGNRKAQVLLSGGTKGQWFTVEHTVQTNENPQQTKSKVFMLRIT